MNKEGREKNGKYQKGRQVPEEERAKIAEGLQGNTNKLKLKKEAQQLVAYEAYCNWIASGKGRQGFVFECEDEETNKVVTITWQTIENYINSKRFDLDPIQKEKAENFAYQVWENVGVEMMQGKVDKCQPAIYQMMMRNKFGWDKETRVTHNHEPDAKRFMKLCDEYEAKHKDKTE
jgi:hypothetical protein